jgi:D-tagatose-1,6-bisphosphate aldolase subunit GatZ/KbaZ
MAFCPFPNVMRDTLLDLRSDHLAGRRGGQVALCSARVEVLAAALESARRRNAPVLIEATANQVNQFGGYSGMTPEAFAARLRRLAARMQFPAGRLVLGADHLGPYVWRREPAERAMHKALELIRQCVRAGFRKIHIDTGAGCADDPRPELRTETAAERAIVLCRAAEDAVEPQSGEESRPVYVIGAEVPPPGGALEDPAALDVTAVDALQEVLHLYEARFRSAGLQSAWDRVLAVVVQPGVEFGDYQVARYSSQRARALSLFHARLPGRMTYEVHSADYQPSESLVRMAADHFVLPKVGPCLTDSFRQAVFGLARIESERLGRRRGVQLSNIREVLEAVMLDQPVYWQSHYRGRDDELRFLRSCSKRDRIRYYWDHPAVASALRLLMANLKPCLAPTWVAAHMPEASAELPPGSSLVDPAFLIRRRIQLALEPYFAAYA